MARPKNCLFAVLAGGNGHAVARLRTRAGRWLTAHAESVGGQDKEISLIVQPSRPHEIAQVLSGAYALTPREAEVARLVAAGCSNPEIAGLLFVSRYTVEDHLKKLYTKLAVNSRSELVSRLFFDQYRPRSMAGLALDARGWFMVGPRGRSSPTRVE
jgi:DNA-binding CsgD family transcriptional regulator